MSGLCRDCGGSGHPDDAILYPIEDGLGQTVGMEPSKKCERCGGTGWEKESKDGQGSLNY